MNHKLSIIIPVYNEIKIIRRFFTKLFKIFKSFNIEYIIINDGSTDGSKEWLNKNIGFISKKKIRDIRINKKKLFKINESKSKINYSKIILINHKKNTGKGSAIISGCKKSSGRFILILDSDLEYDFKDALNMYKIINNEKNNDVIFGSRFSKKLPQKHKYFSNFIVNKLNTSLFNLFFGSNLTDIYCGLKLFSRKVYKKIDLASNGFSIEMEIISQVIKKGFNIKEIPVKYYPRSYSQGKKISWKDAFVEYINLIRFRFFRL